MQRHYPSRLISTICAVLTLLGCGCAPIDPPPTAVPAAARPSSTSTPQPTPKAAPTAADAFQRTATLSTGDAACTTAEIDQYKNAVLPLADEHTLDTYKAQKMEALTDAVQIQAFREKAAARLESMRGIQVPACLQDAHTQLTLGFELLNSTWELIQAKDYSTATTTLQSSYEALTTGLAKIVVLQP